MLPQAPKMSVQVTGMPSLAKIAAARQLLTWVFYAMRDGQVRDLATSSQKAA